MQGLLKTASHLRRHEHTEKLKHAGARSLSRHSRPKAGTQARKAYEELVKAQQERENGHILAFEVRRRFKAASIQSQSTQGKPSKS